MKDQLNTKGYDLLMMDTDQWVFDDHSGTIFDGSFASVLVFAISKGFQISELETGVEMMLAKNNDAIHFGAYKYPIFSFNRKENKKVA